MSACDASRARRLSKNTTCGPTAAAIIDPVAPPPRVARCTSRVGRARATRRGAGAMHLASRVDRADPSPHAHTREYGSSSSVQTHTRAHQCDRTSTSLAAAALQPSKSPSTWRRWRHRVRAASSRPPRRLPSSIRRDVHVIRERLPDRRRRVRTRDERHRVDVRRHRPRRRQRRW